MKKLFYLLLLLPLSIFTSCDKDDLASFDMTLTLSGVTQSGNNFYAVSGDVVTIDNLTVVPTGGKATDVANVMFYVDGAPLFVNPWNLDEPLSFSTQSLSPGTHTVGVTGNLLQVDQSIQNFAANYTLVIVQDEEALPEGVPETGTYSQTISFSN